MGWSDLSPVGQRMVNSGIRGSQEISLDVQDIDSDSESARPSALIRAHSSPPVYVNLAEASRKRRRLQDDGFVGSALSPVSSFSPSNTNLAENREHTDVSEFPLNRTMLPQQNVTEPIPEPGVPANHIESYRPNFIAIDSNPRWQTSETNPQGAVLERPSTPFLQGEGDVDPVSERNLSIEQIDSNGVPNSDDRQHHQSVSFTRENSARELYRRNSNSTELPEINIMENLLPQQQVSHLDCRDVFNPRQYGQPTVSLDSATPQEVIAMQFGQSQFPADISAPRDAFNPRQYGQPIVPLSEPTVQGYVDSQRSDFPAANLLSNTLGLHNNQSVVS